MTEKASLKKEESIIDLNPSSPQPTSQVTDSEEPKSRIDRIISEVQQDMEDLKASKLRFQAVMNKIDQKLIHLVFQFLGLLLIHQ